MNEIWKAVPGLGDKYYVSDLGRVKTAPYLARYTHWRTGAEHFRQTKEKILAQQLMNAGYMLVHLWHDDKRFAKTVHRLVAAAFCPGYFEGADVNHVDGVKTNNAASNLEWVTRTDNHLHAVRLGLNLAAVRVQNPSTGITYDSIQQAAKYARKSHRKVRATFTRVPHFIGDLI